MAGMNEDYLNAIANHGGSIVNYIGLVDDQGNEIDDEYYSRQSVNWTDPVEGLIRPIENLAFNISGGGIIVQGWRGYADETGGIEYGGKDLDPETFTNSGQYILIADDTGISHEAAE